MNHRRMLLAAAIPALASTLLYGQGPLAPPAAPAPSMKSLQQIESRTPISSLPYTIDQPGSYYFTTNLTGTESSDGIVIATNSVTLDLNGFELRPGPNGKEGIKVASPVRNITIRNGVVRDWPLTGINASQASNSLLEGLQAYANGTGGVTEVGMRIGANSVIRGCMAAKNGLYGIRTGHGCTVVDCVVRENGSAGIEVATGSTVRGCSAYENAIGIRNDTGSSVFDCTVAENSGHGIRSGSSLSVSRCTVYANGDDGIHANNSCIIADCMVSYNEGDGISVGLDCRVVGNNCSHNGSSGGDGAGIHVDESNNTIEGNSVTNNDRGIDVDGSVNLIIRNTARGNPDGNYEIVADNRVGTIVTPPLSGVITANGPGAGSGATDPFANFAF